MTEKPSKTIDKRGWPPIPEPLPKPPLAPPPPPPPREPAKKAWLSSNGCPIIDTRCICVIDLDNKSLAAVLSSYLQSEATMRKKI